MLAIIGCALLDQRYLGLAGTLFFLGALTTGLSGQAQDQSIHLSLVSASSASRARIIDEPSIQPPRPASSFAELALPHVVHPLQSQRQPLQVTLVSAPSATRARIIDASMTQPYRPPSTSDHLVVSRPSPALSSDPASQHTFRSSYPLAYFTDSKFSAIAESKPNPSPQPMAPIEPLVAVVPVWPTPSLSPGVPSAFLASWGDVFGIATAATRGNERDVADGSFAAGFGLGNAVKAVALEVAGGCGSIKSFCSNGGFGLRLGRVFVNTPTIHLALTGSWQNGVQWSNEAANTPAGRQDNIYSAALSVATPLQPPGSYFGQTLQFNLGVGNSTFAPYVTTGSESQVGVFASVGVELSNYAGISAGWSGRGVNSQISFTPFRDIPLTLNILGADLFNQTPFGAVGILSLSWRTNFSTPNFAAPNYPTLKF